MLAGVALHAQVYGQGQVSGGGEGEAQFAYAGIAAQVRGVDVEAVGSWPVPCRRNSCSQAAPMYGATCSFRI